MIFGIGIVSIIVGYLLIASSSVDSFMSTKIGPVILFIGYSLIIPFSIFYSGKK